MTFFTNNAHHSLTQNTAADRGRSRLNSSFTRAAVRVAVVTVQPQTTLGSYTFFLDQLFATICRLKFLTKTRSLGLTLTLFCFLLTANLFWLSRRLCCITAALSTSKCIMTHNKCLILYYVAALHCNPAPTYRTWKRSTSDDNWKHFSPDVDEDLMKCAI